MNNCLICGSSPTCKAHIVPRFLLKSEFRANERTNLFLFNKDTNKGYLNRSIHDYFYDSTILCSKCDNLIGKNIEDPAKKVLSGFSLPSKFKIIGETIKHYEHMCQGAFILKPLCISMVWRASISNYETLKEFSLEGFEEKFGSCVFSPDLSSEIDFCKVHAVYFENPLGFWPPQKVESGGDQMEVHWLLNNYFFVFTIGPTEKNYGPEFYENGAINILVLNHVMSNSLLRRYWGDDLLRSLLENTD